MCCIIGSVVRSVTLIIIVQSLAKREKLGHSSHETLVVCFYAGSTVHATVTSPVLAVLLLWDLLVAEGHM